jgi:DNA repair protein RecN (Recombination protein N)
MLNKLTIQNYAIIEELEIDFGDKLNIVTGETGAGKSIIVGALGLILGDRADSSVLQNIPGKSVRTPSEQSVKEKKCIVEGIF